MIESSSASSSSGRSWHPDVPEMVTAKFLLRISTNASWRSGANSCRTQNTGNPARSTGSSKQIRRRDQSASLRSEHFATFKEVVQQVNDYECRFRHACFLSGQRRGFSCGAAAAFRSVSRAESPLRHLSSKLARRPRLLQRPVGRPRWIPLRYHGLTMQIQIETPLSLLRDLEERDLEAIHAYASDPEVVRFMPFGPNSAEETATVLRNMIAGQKEVPRVRFQLAIVPHDVGEVIGVAGLRVTDRAQAEGHIGYALQRRFWNRGYATDACAALLKFGFDTLGLHRVQTTVTVENHGSIRVLQKIGMRQEGHLVERLRIHGRWTDSVLFAILDRESRNAQHR